MPYFNTQISPLPGFGALFHNCCTAIILTVIINLVLGNIRSMTCQTKVTPLSIQIRLDLALLDDSFKTISFSLCVYARVGNIFAVIIINIHSLFNQKNILLLNRLLLFTPLCFNRHCKGKWR